MTDKFPEISQLDVPDAHGLDLLVSGDQVIRSLRDFSESFPKAHYGPQRQVILQDITSRSHGPKNFYHI